MRELLLINPNTTTAITETLTALVRANSPANVNVHAVTAAFGAPYIADEVGYAVAGHAALQAWRQASAERATPLDGVIVGCFGDPGLFALREAANCPVTGLAEAALLEAVQLMDASSQSAGQGRCAIVTGGAAWGPMLRKLLPALAGGGRVAAIETVALSGAQLRADPAAAHALLLEACLKVRVDHGVEAIILGGAGLGGLAAVLQKRIDVPLIDSVLAAARQVWFAPPSGGQGCPPWL
ncbi:Asp/Glu racemase [Hylemonella gracilis str. Niagara R]|uniref:Asp/Glu racemase n=1 Tax=Hylemonella gracilis str. Niagara R TaxID=1458275 RepID=A0A016XGQ1_9BURK|nr:aspartate/glutamate racemase family protein [Hylemonella gracilis]EYC51035.1 Asp/Glu racemase [Hylemonella gracilis str. Niagara R]